MDPGYVAITLWSKPTCTSVFATADASSLSQSRFWSDLALLGFGEFDRPGIPGTSCLLYTSPSPRD
eukprot:12985918-Alexandrium_andersonii.AAC.1